jgi:ABC-type glycerol-3-phosphate transport system substrate-binding protein
MRIERIIVAIVVSILALFAVGGTAAASDGTDMTFNGGTTGAHP